MTQSAAAGNVPQTARPLPVRYRRPPKQLALLALLPVYGLLFPVLMAAGLGDALPGLIAGAALAVALGCVVAALSRLVMLRADLIRIWHGFRFTNIGLSEIAGIGLLYSQFAGQYGGWSLYVWRDFGPMEPAGFLYRPRRRVNGSWATQPRYDPVADSELPALAASRAAVVCQDIYRRDLAAQGSAGPLATLELQKHQPRVRLSPNTRVIAYWSPDGQAGRCLQQQGTGEVDLIGYPLEEQGPGDRTRRGGVRPPGPRGPREAYWRRWA